MPNCRYCGSRISRFDKDLCPICGTKSPLEGVKSDTMEITAQVDIDRIKEGQKVLRRRQHVLLFFALIGFSGAGFFYLKYKLRSLVWMLVNALVITGAFFLFVQVLATDLLLSILLTIGLIYLINISTGIFYYLIPNLKDKEGEYVN
ncbi:MAG: hypothetical protein GX813_02360 [Erysipelotrichia bacterium]|nr:hypothetical protein [Erysipelotrichia bacterium]